MRALFAALVLLGALAHPVRAQQQQCRTAPVGAVSSYCASEAFVTQAFDAPILKKQLFAAIAACSGALEGTLAAVTDSSTATWGATITGNGTNHVLGYCDGTSWTVAAK